MKTCKTCGFTWKDGQKGHDCFQRAGTVAKLESKLTDYKNANAILAGKVVELENENKLLMEFNVERFQAHAEDIRSLASDTSPIIPLDE